MAAEITPDSVVPNDGPPSPKKFKSCDESDGNEVIQTVTPNDIGKKRKVALLLGFCGAGYFGMQRNRGTKTIEEDLINALFKAGAIPEAAKEHEQKMAFQRASRTDKGVHAAAQVVSFKMFVVDDVIAKINSHLPREIRVFGHFRVTKGFNSKTACDARTYKYVMPTYAFANKEKKNMYILVIEATIKHVRDILAMYVGTRNFHNFTSKKAYEDDSAKRYIMQFDCGLPFVRNNLEFVTLTVKGQSFMLHQIRKMIGLMIGIVRGDATIEAMEKAWEKDRVDIPRAPGLGLMLYQLHYHAYNRKIERLGIHSAIDNTIFDKEIEKFTDECINEHIIQKETKEFCFLKWLESLTYHSFDDQPRSARDQTLENPSKCNNDSNSGKEME
ncbi:uncharacterized protein TRIADDRAFT_57795 [Trichoplax adhaerens]|uniref:Pseudouridylate synthase 1 homolog n=1 Tax=Trichoplax adhaerens TaxID=10228 RepID=B3S1D9_TRIAD|nr:hypothetical protein TRIADDRAFT_57795 [Trichoplax adhaerens]EDV22990.1 hypothetical protein TRIADDRAFT_57795 [Trichoplax adhaerens]|eukprot:XP_002113900.1 hypothetical protein TRIADDRAFT_57795 [Trichoplax adhaerens]